MLNVCTFIGHLGGDPEIKSLQSGDRVANFSLAVTEKWTDKGTGDRKEKTEWIRCVCFNQNLVKVAEKFMKKGSKVYISGQMETRSYEKDGQKIYTTEIMLRPFNSQILLLDSKGETTPPAKQEKLNYDQSPIDELEDFIPF